MFSGTFCICADKLRPFFPLEKPNAKLFKKFFKILFGCRTYFCSFLLPIARLTIDFNQICRPSRRLARPFSRNCMRVRCHPVRKILHRTVNDVTLRRSQDEFCFVAKSKLSSSRPKIFACSRCMRLCAISFCEYPFLCVRGICDNLLIPNAHCYALPCCSDKRCVRLRFCIGSFTQTYAVLRSI